MASKTFLELVNEAVDEAKISVDPLTSANFASPPRTSMYARIKRWVNVAYRELLMDRKEWQFRKERATLSIEPRLHLAGVTVAPIVGNVLKGESSEVEFTVTGVYTHEDIERDSDTEYTVSVSFSDTYDPSNLVVREDIVAVSSIPGWTGYLKGWGHYSFREQVTSLESIDPDTVMVREIVEAPETEDDLRFTKVNYLTREQWLPEWELYPFTGERPMYITETNQGTYDVYPKPNGECLLTFEFTRTIPTLTNYDDTPEGIPEEYHDYLVWKAVEEYADFDGNPKLFARARKHTERYRNYLERDYMPDIGIKGWDGVIKRG